MSTTSLPFWRAVVQPALKFATFPADDEEMGTGMKPCQTDSAFWQAALDSLTAHVAVLDEQGKITNDAAVNDLAWREPRKGWGPLEMKV